MAGHPSFPTSATRFWRMVLVGGLVAFVAGLVWLMLSFGSEAEVIARGGSGAPLALPADLHRDAAVYASPATVSPRAVECRIGPVTDRGSAVPTITSNTIDVDGTTYVKAVDLTGRGAGTTITCKGEGVTELLVARDARRGSLTFAIPLLVGGLFICGVAFVLALVTRVSRSQSTRQA